jgi:hypothetical protein
VALPILTLPIAGRDVVRAAFAWNLAVELARLGARTTLIAPRDPGVAPLWPEPGTGPMGADVHFARAADASALAHAGIDVAIRSADEATDGPTTTAPTRSSASSCTASVGWGMQSAPSIGSPPRPSAIWDTPP